MKLRRWHLIPVGGLAIAAVTVAVTAVLSEPQGLPVAVPLFVDQAYVERADTVRRNETLTHLFARHNIEGDELFELLDAANDLNPRRIRANQVFELRYPVGADKPDRVKVRLGDERILTVATDSVGNWTGMSEAIIWSVHMERVDGVIETSLYDALDDIIPDSVLSRAERYRLAWALADDIYGWVIDFYRDFYPGDRVTFVYERLTSPHGDVRFGRVVAARIETRRSENMAYVMTDDRGANAYYDEQGRSLRRAFKLRPVAFARLSSGFSSRRFHPILRRYRPHLGVDFAAMTGTRIEATGDGTVIRAGRWGTFGIMVAIRHVNGIETRYGHMSRLASGLRPGVRVSQGQVIGYVGATGLATAPHVHYEVLKNGRQRDPRARQAGNGQPVPSHLAEHFESLKAQYNRMLVHPRQGQPVTVDDA